MNPGMIGAIVGSLAGVAGGVIGTYMSIRNTSSTQERRYMIRCAIGFWVGITLFLTAQFLLPHPYRGLLWLPYAVALPLSIVAANRGLARIRIHAAGHGG